MKSIILIGILVFSLTIWNSCDEMADEVNGQNRDTTFIEFSNVNADIYNPLRVGRQGYIYFNSNEDWMEYCEKYHGPTTSNCSSLVFADSLLIAVTWKMISGCNDFRESIKLIYITDDTMHISFDYYPHEDCFADTYPMHLVRVYDYGLPIKFHPPYEEFVNYYEFDENCFLEPDYGSCDSTVVRYYYNMNDLECEEFIWSSCKGVVPFETYEQCDTACRDAP